MLSQFVTLLLRELLAYAVRGHVNPLFVHSQPKNKGFNKTIKNNLKDKQYEKIHNPTT